MVHVDHGGKEHGRFQTRMTRCFIQGGIKTSIHHIHPFYLTLFQYVKHRYNKELLLVCLFQILMSISHTGESGVQRLTHRRPISIAAKTRLLFRTHVSTKQFETCPGDVSSWACSHALATGHCASGVSATGLALAGQLERKGSWGKLGELLWKSGDPPRNHWFLLLRVIWLDQNNGFWNID